MTTAARALDKLERLSAQPRSLVSLWDDATVVLKEVVPHYTWPCYFTLDPASLLITSHFHDGLAEFPPEWLAEEYYGDDVNKIADVVRSPGGLATLHEATGGDPSGSAGRRTSANRRTHSRTWPRTAAVPSVRAGTSTSISRTTTSPTDASAVRVAARPR